MKGDFTRLSHDPAKRYSKVLRQQGRADLDADTNELVQILGTRDETKLRDIIGTTGFPKGSGMEVSALADGTIRINPGRAYVDGILAELPGNAPIDYATQPDLPSPPPLVPQNGRRDLVYLDVWERFITAHQDPDIKEVALGGADTATRVQVVCQVRILENVADALTCDSPLEDWAPAPSSGLLSTELDTPAIPPDPCSPLPSSGFRGLENRLYRVEIHSGGNVGAATWKWSRDNGAVTFGIREFRPNEPKRVELVRMGRDALLSIKKDDWAEILGDTTELHGNGGTLTQVGIADSATRILTFQGDVDVHEPEAHPIVRRWDGSPQLTSPDAIELEDGIHVRFSGSAFRPGDYWTFTARTAEEGGLEILQNAAPQGIRHHYAKLAFVEWTQVNNAFNPNVIDCRNLFPPLSDLDASDISFKSDICDFGPNIDTVQEAIEALCREDHECCTLVAKPGPGWEAVFAEIPNGGDAAICFKAGEYPIASGTFVVENKGHLKLTGVGAGTRLVAKSGECVLRFESCKSVTVRDLHASATTTGTSGNAEHLNGALTFRNCNKVSLHSLDLQCANSTSRRASCLTIHNTTPLTSDKGLVDVENCEMRIGDEQVGLLVVNTHRASIRNNRLRVLAPSQRGFNGKITDKKSRSGLIDGLIGNITFTPAKREQPPAEAKPALTRGKKGVRLPNREANFVTTIGDRELRFATERKLVQPLQDLLKRRPPEKTDERSVAQHLRKIGEDLVMGRERPAGALSDFLKELQEEEVSSASQGIVVGGTVGDEVSIAGNTILGASQGIHVGLSHADPARTNPDRGGRVSITRNHVHVHAVLGATRSRHGLFVGNADSIVIRDNYMLLSRFTGLKEAPIDGIRLFGHFGRYINVRENHVDQFGVGVTVVLRGAAPDKKPMWQVYENFLANANLPLFKNHEWIDAKGNLA
ncbi:MAG TPA: DUF6519 domain-containing protein [Thermoanaerobaculia bacterium]|jgi:hypothetical protein